MIYKIKGKLNDRQSIFIGEIFKELKITPENSKSITSEYSPERIQLNYPAYISLKLLNQKESGYKGYAGFDYPELKAVVIDDSDNLEVEAIDGDLVLENEIELDREKLEKKKEKRHEDNKKEKEYKKRNEEKEHYGKHEDYKEMEDKDDKSSIMNKINWFKK